MFFMGGGIEGEGRFAGYCLFFFGIFVFRAVARLTFLWVAKEK